jgi:hypothetical protein
MHLLIRIINLHKFILVQFGRVSLESIHNQQNYKSFAIVNLRRGGLI